MTTALLGTIITAIVGPLLAFFIKRYFENKIQEAQTEDRKKQEEQAARDENKQAADKATDINQSIDKQAAAAEQWAKDHK